MHKHPRSGGRPRANLRRVESQAKAKSVGVPCATDTDFTGPCQYRKRRGAGRMIANARLLDRPIRFELGAAGFHKGDRDEVFVGSCPWDADDDEVVGCGSGRLMLRFIAYG